MGLKSIVYSDIEIAGGQIKYSIVIKGLPVGQ